MSEMFKNYPQPEDYIPNNMHTCHPQFKIDIMTGETASHSFEVPFDVEASCLNYYVMYKLGIELIIEKDKNHLEVNKTNCGSIITCRLSSEETSKFAHTCLSTKVQLRFMMANGEILYSEIYNVGVTSSLSSEIIPPVSRVIPGFGNTED